MPSSATLHSGKPFHNTIRWPLPCEIARPILSVDVAVRAACLHALWPPKCNLVLHTLLSFTSSSGEQFFSFFFVRKRQNNLLTHRLGRAAMESLSEPWIEGFELVLALLPLFEEQSVLFSLFRRLGSEVGAALTTEDTRSKAFPLPCQKLRRDGPTGRRKKWTRKTRGRRMGRKRKEQSPCPVKELPEAASHFDLLPDFSPFRGLYLFSHYV